MQNLLTGNALKNISSNTQSDDELIQRICKNDFRAFELIMRRYNQRLFRITRSILLCDDQAQDAIQETYISMYQNLKNYRQQGKFSAWLSRIAMNEALMMKRKNQKFQHTNTENHVTSSISEEEPINLTASAQITQLIEDCIDQLPEDLRMVFILRNIEQLNTQETAELLQLNPATVKTRLHRSKERLQNLLLQTAEENQLSVYEFAGSRCDAIVVNVLTRLHNSRKNRNIH